MERKNRYAVFTMKTDVDATKERLKRHDLKVVNVEETTPAYALCCFGIWPTEEVVSKLPYTATMFVEGTESSFQEYCADPVSDIGDYWSKG